VRRAAVILAAAAALAAPAAAQADSETISMPGKFFDPTRSTVVAGDVVTWRNADFVTHDVRVAAGLYDSGPILRSGSWTQGFDQPGEYPFRCTLHAFMTGNLSVVAATLETPKGPVLEGGPLRLTGRAPAGTAALTVERAEAGGGWAPVGAPVVPGADGGYAATTPAKAGASYRVTGPAGASPALTPAVTARVDVHVTLRGRRLEVHAMPAPEGLHATLELYRRWRYRWAEQRTRRLDGDGMARFRLPHGPNTYARVTLRAGKGGPALVASRILRTRNGRTAPDPDTGGAPMPSGEHAGH
jgi:plastocyanin